MKIYQISGWRQIRQNDQLQLDWKASANGETTLRITDLLGRTDLTQAVSESLRQITT
ncbi:MAG: hypothetical protein ABIO04_01490 [Ferruginibacter sp.]